MSSKRSSSANTCSSTVFATMLSICSWPAPAIVIGCAGLEVYGDAALLRSVAVEAEHRRGGVGAALTRAALDEAARSGIAAVYLLTTTAERFFPRFGFEIVDRADVPAAVQSSVEFAHASCASAVVMRKRLAAR
jgi:amino-acid N-acetyltransferase